MAELRPHALRGPPLTAADRDACRQRFGELRNDGTFTPPSLRGSLIIPSNVGGAHWGGLAYDPRNDVVIIPTNRIAAVITLIPRGTYEARQGKETVGERIGTEYAMMRGTPFVLKREVFLGPAKRAMHAAAIWHPVGRQPPDTPDNLECPARHF